LIVHDQSKLIEVGQPVRELDPWLTMRDEYVGSGIADRRVIESCSRKPCIAAPILTFHMLCRAIGQGRPTISAESALNSVVDGTLFDRSLRDSKIICGNFGPSHKCAPKRLLAGPAVTVARPLWCAIDLVPDSAAVASTFVFIAITAHGQSLLLVIPLIRSENHSLRTSVHQQPCAQMPIMRLNKSDNRKADITDGLEGNSLAQ
jgi:hypothetical protein